MTATAKKLHAPPNLSSLSSAATPVPMRPPLLPLLVLWVPRLLGTLAEVSSSLLNPPLVHAGSWLRAHWWQGLRIVLPH